MSQSEREHNDPESADRQSRLDAVLAELMNAGDRDDTIRPSEWLKRFPEFAEELRGYFQDHQQIEELVSPLRDAATRLLRVRCPHCRNAIELIEEATLAEVNCPKCGSSFSLVGAQQGVSPQLSGRSIGHFELIEQVGMGQFGTVYKARDTQLDRIVAVKIPRHGQLDETQTALFLRDARAAAQLNDSHIVSVHEVGTEDGTLYIVSDFIDGITLQEQIRSERMSFDESASLCATIATALQHAHEQQVIHRDLKPSNIILNAEGLPFIVDFGLAKREVGEITMTMEGQILGTPAYMPPEQARGEGHQADARADIYSLGVILFELLTGEIPFRGEKQMLIVQIQIDDPPRPRHLNHRIPAALETICLKCLEKEPHRRYASAAALAADLQRFLNGEPILARPPNLLQRAASTYRKNRGLALSVASILVLLLVFMIVGWRITASERVTGLLDTNTAQVSQKIAALRGYRIWAHRPLLDAYRFESESSDAKLHAALAILPDDKSVLPFLKDRLLTVTPMQFEHVRDLLDDDKDELVEFYWETVETGETPELRFQAACALASYDSENEHWQDKDFQTFVSGHLVGVRPSELLPWTNALRPVKDHLTSVLATIYSSSEAGEQVRSFATDTLADYLSDNPEGLFNLLADANEKQFGLIFGKLVAHQERAIELGIIEVGKTISEDASEDDKESLAMRQANVAVMLLRMDAAENVWTLLKHSPDPRVRSYIIHWLSPRGGEPQAIITRYEQETDVTIKRALLLCLGEFELADSDQQPVIETLLTVYRTDPDAGLHAAAEWLLKQWQVTLPELPMGEPVLPADPQRRVAELAAEIKELRQRMSDLESRHSERRAAWEQELLQRPVLPQSLRDGLGAHYLLDASEGIDTPNAVTGQPGGRYRGPGEPEWVPGIVGQALQLDGQGGQFDCGDGFQFERTDSFSFGCWFLSDRANPTAALFSKLDINTVTGFNCWLENGRFGPTLIHNGGADRDNAVKLLSDQRLANGAWHHAFVVYDGTSGAAGVRVFVDGQLVPSSVANGWSSVGGTIETHVPLTLGGYSGVTSEGFGGCIDDVRIYNRELCDDDVGELFRSGLQSLVAVPLADRTPEQQALLSRICRSQDELLLDLQTQLSAAETRLRNVDLEGMRRWYLNSQGQTFAILDAGEFQMGSPESETGRDTDERLHRRQIVRRFAIATKEVSREQWCAFSAANEVWSADQDQLKPYIRSDDSPMVAMTWYEATHYCNWLSEQEGIPEDQWCYEKNEDDAYGPGMKAREDFLDLRGYRLPTEAESEYACRAGSSSSRYYGVTEMLLPRYAWYQANSENQTHPVASLKPNDFGLFDMQGNAYEWCYDSYESYPAVSVAVADAPSVETVDPTGTRLLRGGSFFYLSSSVRSAARTFSLQPGSRGLSSGFRPARTYHLFPLP